MIVLLVKASLIVMVLLIFYKMFLERESFFAANRIYLLSCLMLACLMPFVALPEMVEHQGVIAGFFETRESTDVFLSPEEIQLYEDEPAASRSLENNSAVDVPAGPEISRQVRDMEAITQPKETSTFPHWLLLIYGFGALVFFLKLVAQMVRTLRTISSNKDNIRDEGITIVNMQGTIDPCSFFRYIFINPADYISRPYIL